MFLAVSSKPVWAMIGFLFCCSQLWPPFCSPSCICNMKWLAHLEFICFVACFHNGLCMYQKRGKGYQNEEVSPSKRLRANLEDLFLGNDISALRARDIFQDAHDSGVAGVHRLSKAGKRGELPSHVHRDLLRTVMKPSRWPDVYVAEVRTWSNKLQLATKTKVPMLLPHEILQKMVLRGTKANLLTTEGYFEESLNHLNAVIAETGIADLMGLGLWLDGTPCAWDRTECVETIALSFPGLNGPQSSMRIPLAAVLKSQCMMPETHDDILSILSWSMACLLTGTMPSCRHDGSAWSSSDTRRSRMSGKPIGISAIIIEVRADWACLKSTFRFPGWREKAGCCFKCNIEPNEIRNCGSSADWRATNRRHTHWSLMDKILNLGKGMSPLFSAPYLTKDQFIIDWLHCCDLGVGQDFWGNYLLFMMKKMNGRSQDAQLKNLWQMIQTYYRATEAISKLDNLTLTMLQKKATSSPKLRSKAGETRGLIPLAKELAESLLDAADPIENTVREMAVLLHECYQNLSSSQFSNQVLKDACRRFLILYASLEKHFDNGISWRFKPKFHLWQELCEFSVGCPSLCWTYRLEDIGGSVAKLATRRGCKKSAAVTGYLVLNKFRAKHGVPIVA